MKALTSISLALLALGFAKAWAGQDEPARIRLSAALLEDTVQGILPTPIRVPPPTGEPSPTNRPSLARLTEIKYCGATDKGAGRLRALLRLDPGEGPALLGKTGCQGVLADVAKRLAEESRGAEMVVADVEATWKPWELRLQVTRAEGTTKAVQARVAAALERRRELLVVPTADSRIQTGSGPIALYAVPSFLPSAVEIAILIGEDGAPSAPAKLAVAAREPELLGDATVAAQIPLPFANQLLRRLTWSRPVTVPVGSEEVELQRVSIGSQGAGERARLTLSGNATSLSMRETARWTIVMVGDPLRVSSVEIAPQLEDCKVLETVAALACNLRNGARIAAAETFAASLTQRYQGAKVHELVSPQTFRVSVAEERLTFTGDLFRMALGPRGLSASAKLSVPPP
jgi:hypothetical protein